jgi:nucleoid-associated protein YgaU
MNSSILRALAVGLLVVGFAAGCATTPEPTEPEAVDEAAKAAAERAIAEAKSVTAEASALGYEWRDTGKLIEEAEAAFAAGDFATAKSKADMAAAQSREAINQHYLEAARYSYENNLKNATGLTADQKLRMTQLEEALRAADGRRAYDLAMRLEAELAAARMIYTVMSGDSLWTIAGKSDVYGDPYQWPLIYKANASQIEDADLIFPGQEFEVVRNPSDADVAAAVNHAKTRGAWSVGTVEASDTNYLAQ